MSLQYLCVRKLLKMVNYQGNGIVHVTSCATKLCYNNNCAPYTPVFRLPYLPVYKSIPCISRPPFLMAKKSNFLISLLNVHGTLILYSSISGNVDTQKNQGLKRLHVIVLWFSISCICGHFVLEFRKSS